MGIAPESSLDLVVVRPDEDNNEYTGLIVVVTPRVSGAVLHDSVTWPEFACDTVVEFEDDSP